MDLHEVYRNSGLGKWFHGESANKTPGWDRYNSEGEMVGECGDADKGAAYSACLSKQKAQKLGKEGRASFVKRKRAAQSEAGRGEKGAGGKGQKPINVDTGASKMDECVECNEELELINEGKNKPNDPEKWSDCKSAAKSKFDVYPSAYANAWAAKCYKKKGGSWSTVKEEVQQLTKDNIISNLLENKMKGGPGKTSQRPKSWDKGTKAGSEKRKMREEGKREAREMNEEAEKSKKPDGFKSVNPSNNVNPPRFKQYGRGRGSRGGYWLQGPNGPDDRVRSGPDDPDAYDKRRDGYYEESIKDVLRSRLIEGGSWGPEVAGSSQDDMTAAAYADEDREKSIRKPKPKKEPKTKLRKS